jgi:hypothetical protein
MLFLTPSVRYLKSLNPLVEMAQRIYGTSTFGTDQNADSLETNSRKEEREREFDSKLLAAYS